MKLDDFRRHAALLAEYSLALIHHWKAGITGGFLTALLTAWAVMGGKIAAPVGVAFVVGMLVAAPFRAWQEEHVGRQVIAEITRVNWSTTDDQRIVVLGVRLINKGPHLISFRPEWHLRASSANGRRTVELSGKIQMQAPDDALEPMKDDVTPGS